MTQPTFGTPCAHRRFTGRACSDLTATNAEPVVLALSAKRGTPMGSTEVVPHRLVEIPQRLLLYHLRALTQPLKLGSRLRQLASLRDESLTPPPRQRSNPAHPQTRPTRPATDRITLQSGCTVQYRHPRRRRRRHHHRDRGLHRHQYPFGNARTIFGTDRIAPLNEWTYATVVDTRGTL